jgi:SAM-dependent methyltransferase
MTHLCRFCSAPLEHVFCDLGTSPASNSFVRPEDADRPEPFYPLKVYVCADCKLVQLPAHKSAADIFTDDYVYFSSHSSGWLAHAEAYCEAMAPRFGLGGTSLVVEIASNDGYLLQFFKRMGVPVLGVEPTRNTADAAREAHGIESIVDFFGVALAKRLAAEGRQADLLLGNNVLAHVPDINDFVAGLAIALKPGGVITMEFPHLSRLIAENQFDTIYHEHFSYLSLTVVEKVFAQHGLALFDVDELPTHGGSLRIYAQHAATGGRPREARVDGLIARERSEGLADLGGYAGFDERVRAVKRDLLEFLIRARRDGKRVAAYGAAAKGNTLLNFCGARTDFVDFVVDRAPSKQGRLLPGTRIPVHAPEALERAKPDYVLILPWNIRDEIVRDWGERVRAWGGAFVVAIPRLEILR